MNRLFDEHKKRAVSCLDGAWRFSTDPDGVGIRDEWFRAIPEWQTVVVPSVWNTQLGLLEYEGAAFYQRDFYTEGGTLRFVFEGVLTEGDVWLDGKHIVNHYGGFCQFDAIVEGVSEGVHTLTVRADNSFDSDSIPQSYVDWYHYGGITRSVWVERLSGISVLSSRLVYSLEGNTADCRVEYDIYNASDAELADNLVTRVFNREITTPVTLRARESATVSSEDFTLKRVWLWSPEQPKLYTLETVTSTDDLTDKVGFRTVKATPEGIFVNGIPYEIRGVNRHEEHPDFGFAFPGGLMRRDIDIAFDMGCNSLRGAHYPNSRRFVDMLDERGMLFWSEIPIWGEGFSKETLGNEKVRARGLEMHAEMMKHYYNHPSIIIWGLHNEIKTDTEEAREMTERYFKAVREKGGNRLITYATNHPLTDICYAYCDVISVNMYIGWYGKKLHEWAEFLREMESYIDSTGNGGKPIIMSEFGAAAVFGHRSFDDNIWTEDYQAKLIEHTLTLFHNDKRICGTYIWHFADIKTMLAINRARSYNNKGLLNEYRQPKAAYFTARTLYRAFAAEEAERKRLD